MRYLVLPGYGGSGPAHWQSLWEAGDPSFRRVGQRDWERPAQAEWVAALEAAVASEPAPCVLVAHSLACLLVAHWATSPGASVAKAAAAFLAAPVDPEGPAFPPDAVGFAPAPMSRLPFPSLAIASSDDPYATLAFARACAEAWGSRFVPVGAKGHINAASGLGDWPEGRALLASLAPPA